MPANAKAAAAAQDSTKHDWTPKEIFKSWQFYALVLMFTISTQSGLLIIANAAGLLKKAAADVPFLAANAWILVSFGGLVNASGRVGTGFYSDKIGRVNAYCLNCAISAGCMFILPYVIAEQNIVLLFLVVGVAYWQYGGGLSLMPSFTADFFGSKYLGFNYGLVFIGWGMGFFMTSLGGTIEDLTGSLRWAFYMSAGLLMLGVVVAYLTNRPKHSEEKVPVMAKGMVAEEVNE
jgi:OFA family oxalate/formate antiporter-like MFS transporter